MIYILKRSPHFHYNYCLPQPSSEPRKKKKERAPWQKDDNYEGMTDDEFDESSYLKGRLALSGKTSGDIPQKNGKMLVYA